MSKEIPLISSLFPNLNLTEFSKVTTIENKEKENLTDISKPDTNIVSQTDNFISLKSSYMGKPDFKPKFYILSKINNQEENKSSGGVVRLSISPSQGDNPGFKSRPEHPYPHIEILLIQEKTKKKYHKFA